MLQGLLHTVASILVAPIVFVGSFFAQPAQEDPAPLGAALPEAVALFETSLAAPITNSATTMTLTANAVRGGGSLSGYNCFTIDEGSSQAEFVCGIVATTTVTNMVRGVSPLDGITADTDLQFAHRRGASVKITDFPLVQIIKAQNNGEETYPNVLTYDASVVPSGSNEIADVGYVLSAISGTSSLAFDKSILPATAGETITQGQIVYFDAIQGEWMRASASVAASSSRVQLGIAQGGGTNGNSISGGVLTRGYDTTNTGGTPGLSLYLSNTAGATSTATGTIPVTLGQYRAPGAFYFDPIYANIAHLSVPNTFLSTTTFSLPTLGLSSTTIYTATSTYTKSAGVVRVCVDMWSAGASGASGDTNGDNAGGGGGGAHFYFCTPASSLNATTSIGIGSGGLAVTGDAAGLDGGATTFGSTTVYGGKGGVSSANAALGGTGAGLYPNGLGCLSGETTAAVSSGTGTSTIHCGAPGGSANDGTNSNGSNSIWAGAGGASVSSNVLTLGTAGNSEFGGDGGASGTTGATAGSVPGGGGGGNVGTGNSGAGARGEVRVTEFFF